MQQRDIRLLQLLFAAFGLVAAGTGNGQHHELDETRPVTKLSSCPASHFADSLHAAREHTHAVAQQTAVGGIVNVRFDNRGVDAKLAAAGDFVFDGNLDHSFMQFLDDIGTQLPRQTAYGFVIGDFAAANACGARSNR